MGVPIPNGKLGMWLFLGTEIMFFTAFIGTYIVLRLGSKGWPADPEITHIRVYAGGINTFVLITSSVFVVKAHEAMLMMKYRLATNWIIATTALAFVFLGIKSYEYYGKWDHDILPGHVAESPRQALDKLARELDGATGLMDLQEQQTKIDNQIALADSQGNESRSKSLKVQRDEIQKQLAGLGPIVSAYRDRPKVAQGEPEKLAFREKIKGGTASLDELHQAEADLHRLREATNIAASKERLATIENPATIESLNPEERPEALALKAQVEVLKEADPAQLQRFRGALRRVHDPHFIKWGNTFSSIYFLMTGFHALHVVLGMFMFAIVIWLGLVNRLGAQHALVVENFGLYWHFVDLVWIFLFPLIYIV
jgi:cytochrome c oxidase subunit 3